MNELLEVGSGNHAKVARLNELRAALDEFFTQSQKAGLADEVL
jgi:hypothetical protein